MYFNHVDPSIVRSSWKCSKFRVESRVHVGRRLIYLEGCPLKLITYSAYKNTEQLFSSLEDVDHGRQIFLLSHDKDYAEDLQGYRCRERKGATNSILGDNLSTGLRPAQILASTVIVHQRFIQRK